jgi:hypothetical protein
MSDFLIKKIFILLLFVFIHKTYSQNSTLTGAVFTIDGQPIESASVVLKDGVNIIGYDYTKLNGTYFISFKTIPESQLTIQVNSLGYKGVVENFMILNTTNKYEKDFTLTQKVESLNTVVLRPEEKIKINRDTIAYKISAFKDGSERTVEDMLKKIPGIEVSENGNITALGKPIQKILIEGDDLADSNYKVISQNLNIEVLDKIEIINNYDENPVLKQFLNSENVVLNLKLINAKKSIFFGKIEAGGGVENRYFGDANIGFVNPVIKFLDLANANNTGNPAQNQFNQYVVTTGGFNDFSKSYARVRTPIIYLQGSTIELEDKTYIQNNTVGNNLLLNKKFNDSLKVRNSFYFFKDSFEKEYLSTILYLSDNPISFSEKNTFENQNLNFQNDFQLNFTPSKNSNFVFKNTLFFDNGINKNNLLFNETSIQQKLDNNTRELEGQAQYTQKLNTGALVVDLFVGSKKLSQSFLITPNTFTQDSTLVYSSLLSENNLSLDYQGIDASLIFKNNKTSYSFTSGLEHVDEAIGVENFSRIKNNNVKNDSLSGNNSATSYTPHFQIKVEHELFKEIFLQGDVDTEVNYYRKNDFRETFYIPNTALGLSIRKRTSGSYNFRFRYNNDLPRLANFTENFIVKNYRSLDLGQPIPELLTSYNYYFGYTFSRIKERILFNASLSYTDYKNKFTFNNLLSNNADISQRIYTEGQNLLLINTGFTTYSDKINSSFKIGFQYNYNESPTILNNNRVTITNNTTSYYIRGTTYFNGPLNFRAHGQYTINRGENNGSIIKNERYKINTNAIWKVSNKMIASLIHNGYIISSKYYETTNAEITFEPNKKNWSLRFQAQNLLNNKTYVFENVDSFVQVENVFTTIPRYILATGIFRF